jgi:hypothetical protein
LRNCAPKPPAIDSDTNDPGWQKYYQVFFRFQYLHGLAYALQQHGLYILDEEKKALETFQFMDDEYVKAGLGHPQPLDVTLRTLRANFAEKLALQGGIP